MLSYPREIVTGGGVLNVRVKACSVAIAGERKKKDAGGSGE